MLDITIIERNFRKIVEDIYNVGEKIGKNPANITIVTVTKTIDANTINTLCKIGITDVGENRIQEAVEKYKVVKAKYKWHFIGHLQTNKVKKALEIFDVIHSLDRLPLALKIQDELQKNDKNIDAFIQVNVSKEKTKSGIYPEDVEEFASAVRKKCKNINLIGLMTIAPLSLDPEKIRPYFRQLREIRDKIGLRHLSMGMSQDYTVAVEEGASFLRIGTAIFKNSTIN